MTREAAEALRHYLDALDIDPARQEEIERKAAALEALARKHRAERLGSAGAAGAHRGGDPRARRAPSTASRQMRAQARPSSTATIGRRRERLTEARTRAAARSERQITALMQALGMAGGRFAVSVDAERGRSSAPTAATTSSSW